MKILAVDDDQSLLNLLGEVLGRSGYQVDLAVDGATAMRMFREERPDLAIIDLAMPEIDGFQVIEQMRADKDGAQLPIIVLSAHEDDDKRARASTLGVRAYLVKPMLPRDLVAQIEALLGETPH